MIDSLHGAIGEVSGRNEEGIDRLTEKSSTGRPPVLEENHDPQKIRNSTRGLSSLNKKARCSVSKDSVSLIVVRPIAEAISEIIFAAYSPLVLFVTQTVSVR